MKSTASVVCLSLTITHCVVDGDDDDDDDDECLLCDLYFVVQFQVPPQVLSFLLWSTLTVCVWLVVVVMMMMIMMVMMVTKMMMTLCDL